MAIIKELVFFWVVAAVFACASFFSYQYLTDQAPMVAMLNHDRSPSSIQKVSDYSELVGSALESAAKHRLMDTIQMTAKNGDVYIEMGNFVLLNDSRQKDFACGYFNKMTFEFEAEGVLVEGEKPVLTVETGCDVASNINFMLPFKIPVKDLKSQQPSQTEYKFFEQGRPTSVSLQHSPQNWPTVWNLKDIKMSHNSIPSRLLYIPTIDSHKQNKISMKW